MTRKPNRRWTPSPPQQTLGAIALLVLGGFSIDVSGWTAILLAGDALPGIGPLEYSGTLLYVLSSAITSTIFIAAGSRLQTLRACPCIFYVAAVFILSGLALVGQALPRPMLLICFLLFAAGNTTLLFFWLELMTRFNSHIVAAIIVLSALTSSIAAAIPWASTHATFTFFVTVAATLICLNRLDRALGKDSNPRDSRPLEVDKHVLIGTIAGLCLASMISGITQNLAFSSADSGAFYPGSSDLVTVALLAVILLSLGDVNLSTGVKIISSLTIGSLLLLLLPNALNYPAYVFASMSYGLLTGLGYYTAVLMAKTRAFSTPAVFGIMGAMLFSSSIVLFGLAVAGIDIADRSLIALLTLGYSLAAIWLLSDRGIDLLVTAKYSSAHSHSAAQGDFGPGVQAIAGKVGLTPRETDVLALASSGRSVPFMAEKLVLSENTVKSYLQKVYAKCGVHSRQELISLAEQAAVEAINNRNR